MREEHGRPIALVDAVHAGAARERERVVRERQLKLLRTRARAADQVQIEHTTDDGWFSSIGRTVSEFWNGEREGEEDIDPGEPELEAAPSTEVILRVIGQLNGATPEEEADIAARYGQRAYEAAKRRIADGQ